MAPVRARSNSVDVNALRRLHRRDADSEDEQEELGDFLPPLQSFMCVLRECASLEADLLPSTPIADDLAAKTEEEKSEPELLTVNCLETNDIPLEPVYGWDVYDLRLKMHNAAEQAEEFATAIWHKLQTWKVIHFSSLPQWLQDNDFLHFGHRPPLPTSECFKSIVRIHTETGNIWTHLLGVLAFVGLAIHFLSRSNTEVEIREKIVFAIFFIGAIACLGLSFLYHTLGCHVNPEVGRLFAKFDYCGIAFLTVGSFAPWLHYSFYCEWRPQLFYMSIVILLGLGAVVVSTFDFFAGPKFRPLRACVFIFFGLSGIAPATHYLVQHGLQKSLNDASLGWLVLMGSLYITGAVLYAVRIPERFFPGKVDIWFHSHQIFHCFVMAGAFVHYHGISLMAIARIREGQCPVETNFEACSVANHTSVHQFLP